MIAPTHIGPPKVSNLKDGTELYSFRLKFTNSESNGVYYYKKEEYYCTPLPDGSYETIGDEEMKFKVKNGKLIQFESYVFPIFPNANKEIK